MRLDAPWRVVRLDEAEPAIWGDAASGMVADRVYGRGRADGLYLCHSTIETGAGFTLSESAWPVSLGWNAIHVLRGRFLALEPFTGETRLVGPQETLVVPPRLWHFGRSIGDEPLEMLEFIGPATEGARREELPRPAPLSLDIGREAPRRKGSSAPRSRPLRLDASGMPSPTRLRRMRLTAPIAFVGEASLYVVAGDAALSSSGFAVKLAAGDAALALRAATVNLAALSPVADLVVAGRFRLPPA